MAKYTELFSEFLARGNSLPAAFNQIVGFDDLFSQFYGDHEIGFETEELFAMKLNAYANIYIPAYAERINNVTALMAGIMDPEKVRETVHDLGESETLQWVLPYNADAGTPSGRTRSPESTNTDTLTETGYTPDEILRIYESLRIVEYNITRALLNEFRPLFMMIY